MQPILSIPRIDDLSAFHDEYFVKNLPVVAVGAAKLMPAFSKWSDGYLSQVLAEARTMVRLSDGRLANMRGADFFGYLAEPEKFSSSVGAAYLADFYIRPAFGDPARLALAGDVGFPLNRGEQPVAEWVSLYAGPSGTGTPMHRDGFATNTWLAQLRGQKIWRLCAPGTVEPSAAASMNAFDGTGVTSQVYEAVLEPGDLISLPPNWWHQVKNTTTTLALSGNFCSFAAAHEALAQVLRSPDMHMAEAWLKTWRAVLETEPPVSHPRP